MSAPDGEPGPLTREVLADAARRMVEQKAYPADDWTISPRGAAEVRSLLGLPTDWPITKHDLTMAVQVLYDRATEEERIAMLRAALGHGWTP